MHCFHFQVTPVFINQQNGTQAQTQALSLDLLKANGTPTLVTDSNGNHYLIALTSPPADGQNGVSSLAKANGRITLQVRELCCLLGDCRWLTSSAVMFISDFLFSSVRGCNRVRVKSSAVGANQRSQQWLSQSKRYFKHLFFSYCALIHVIYMKLCNLLLHLQYTSMN